MFFKKFMLLEKLGIIICLRQSLGAIVEGQVKNKFKKSIEK